MCTYHGILEEYPLISIDSFETHNYTSTMFFITHIHMDHLVGLERPEFGKYVAKINAPIYMSEISKQLLSTMAPYRHLVPNFKSVPIDQPFALTIQSNDPVQAKKIEGASTNSRPSLSILIPRRSRYRQSQDESILTSTEYRRDHSCHLLRLWPLPRLDHGLDRG